MHEIYSTIAFSVSVYIYIHIYIYIDICTHTHTHVQIILTFFHAKFASHLGYHLEACDLNHGQNPYSSLKPTSMKAQESLLH